VQLTVVVRAPGVDDVDRVLEVVGSEERQPEGQRQREHLGQLLRALDEHRGELGGLVLGDEPEDARAGKLGRIPAEEPAEPSSGIDDRARPVHDEHQGAEGVEDVVAVHEVPYGVSTAGDR
jgi:hypothetical protein